MQLYSEDTIAAPITAPGIGAVALVRISGPEVRTVAERLFPSAKKVISSPRRLIFTPIFDTADGEVLDHGLAVFFPNPNSFTGEDSLEIHLHGSPYLLNRLLDNLVHLGVRPARPGEFTYRAYQNGRMDLSQAEAVADLVSAETEAQARLAREQLEGRLSQAVSGLGEPLRNVLAEIEAYIDFPEEDIEPLTEARWAEELEPVQMRVERYLETYRAGRLCREGAQVVLAGLPNAGKSSLLNALVGEERAIVTPIPGTTRDSIEEHLSIEGLAVRLWDTAGIVEEGGEAREIDEVERLGVERSRKRVAQADLVLYVFAADLDLERQAQCYLRLQTINGAMLPLLSKADLLAHQQKLVHADAVEQATGKAPLIVSAAEHQGMKELGSAIAKELLGEHRSSASLLLSNRRHRSELEQCRDSLRRARLGIDDKLPPELIAFEVRSAVNALSSIIGVTTNEDVLGRIFSKFCIGK